MDAWNRLVAQLRPSPHLFTQSLALFIGKKSPAALFVACPLRDAIPAARKPWVAILATRSTQCVSPLDGTLRVDLRSTKRAPARFVGHQLRFRRQKASFLPAARQGGNANATG